MNQLQIIQNEDGKQAVQCSQLYKALGLDANKFLRWTAKNIIDNPFAIEGEDYILLSSPKGELRNKRRSLTRHYDEINNLVTPLNSPNGRIRTRKRTKDFVLTLDFAKRLAMMCRTEQGERVRRYFLECERIAKEKESLIIEALQKRLSAYERLEQIRLVRLELLKEVKELKAVLITTPQLIDLLTNQLTFNFN
ncbi:MULTISPECIES: antA/AntB antirepressor family protein [Flavobacterium]|uniref:AntA/AntB antirepressor domain-containing protein n=1 Tax=Flavobacterium columnare TaxID=996 RepID=A0A0X8C3K5_9FLAO|nr:MULTISPECIES: antA/AntB antirepressor family protein [Flavobacterium]AMA50442.1 hypothetical protein AWN65_13725 [Flavobacterium covae]MCJ1809081.1 antA/AntB antirepressor family protein [Flavobacterium covae]OWP79732.1 hypothetical protein BWK62_00395 [Flavobacterium oreochromis]